MDESRRNKGRNFSQEKKSRRSEGNGRQRYEASWSHDTNQAMSIKKWRSGLIKRRVLTGPCNTDNQNEYQEYGKDFDHNNEPSVRSEANKILQEYYTLPQEQSPVDSFILKI
ncbi:hypothetical protein PoB_001655800 [Plakobranchus ocellatus]|uniref:Uncharacterized protein n=1 Tax=Plakobranchus ocellatus TaxID=259542 RepID=A0AAV3Z6F4_9GAST|nr:hypothetical protein PoB_001655800 [Plakobranchus ocellatus]